MEQAQPKRQFCAHCKRSVTEYVTVPYWNGRVHICKDCQPTSELCKASEMTPVTSERRSKTVEIYWTDDQLFQMARLVSDAIIEDTLSFILPVDVEDWRDFHGYVDANMYAIDAYEAAVDAAGMPRVNEEDDEYGISRLYRFYEAVEDVAFAVYRVTQRLEDLRRTCRLGAHVEYDDATLEVTSRVYRDPATRELHVAVQVAGDGEGTTILVPLSKIKAVNN